MFTISIEEINHLARQSNAPASDILHLLESAYFTIAHGISIALENEGNIDGMVCDNEWTEFPITIIPSANTDIMPHCVEIEGIIYNADYAVRVLACCMASVEFVRFAERVVSLEEVG